MQKEESNTAKQSRDQKLTELCGHSLPEGEASLILGPNQNSSRIC